MSKLLDVMFLNHCPHEFSWPRRSQSGECYQVCLRCGDQYGYDWKKMRRLDRVALPLAESGSRTKWLPRARRIQLSIPVRYRKSGAPDWHDGEIQNISESGVFLAATESLPEKTPVEMAFEMPVQISGRKNSPVLCSGQVARMKPKHGDAQHVFAVAINSCNYLHADTPATARFTKLTGGMSAAAIMKAVRCRTKRRV
jgi:hypothetical protein